MTTGKRVLTTVVIAAAALAAVYVARMLLLQEARDASSKQYQYDITRYRITPPELVRYVEALRVEIEMKEIRGVAVDGKDNIYITGDKAVVILDREGKEQGRFGLETPAGCIAVDGAGDIYLGMKDHIEVYSASGERKAEWTDLGEKAIITSIAVSTDDVFAADSGSRLVWRFDRSGKLLGRIGEKKFIIPSPYFDVAVGPDGSLWTANTGRRSMECYTYEGELVKSWGRAGMEIDKFCGCCNPSHFAIRSDGSFVTAEKGLERIKIYDREGRFLCVVAGPEEFVEGTVGIDIAVDSRGRVLAIDPKTRTLRIFEKKDDE